jgi:hypothetical protein
MLYIGIDTGTDTGLAVWNGRYFTHLQTMKIHKALEYVAALATANPGAVCVVIEDARQRKWIPKERGIKERVGRAQGAGSVKRDASIWTEFCKDKKIPLLAVPPRKGMTKWDEDYWRKVTGWKGRTSEHARDAALLVWGK